MHAVPKRGLQPALGTDIFLVYLQRFDIIPQINPRFSGTKGPFPDPVTTMYSVRRAKRSDGSVMGDVVPLHQLRTVVDLVPCFGEMADPRLTKENVLEYSKDFWVNKYFTKEIFFALYS
jgi:hypothetical protein